MRERRPRTQAPQKTGQWRGAHFFPPMRRVGWVLWAWTILGVLAFVVGTASLLMGGEPSFGVTGR